MTEVNVPLLRKHIEWAETEAALPNGKWDQGMWAEGTLSDDVVSTTSGVYQKLDCGTSFCLAGNVCEEQGDTFVVSHCYGELGGIAMAHSVLTSDGDVVSVSKRAADLLGISHDQREALFYEGNSISDLREIAEEIAGERL